MDTKFNVENSRILGQRYHHLLIEKLKYEYNGKKPPLNELEKTFRLYEKKFAELLKGEVGIEEIEFLKTLPDVSVWINNRPSEEFVLNSMYFKDTKPKISNDPEILVEQALVKFPEDKRKDAKKILNELVIVLSKEEFHSKFIA